MDLTEVMNRFFEAIESRTCHSISVLRRKGFNIPTKSIINAFQSNSSKNRYWTIKTSLFCTSDDLLSYMESDLLRNPEYIVKDTTYRAFIYFTNGRTYINFKNTKDLCNVIHSKIFKTYGYDVRG